MSEVKVGINGFGRIGRQILRVILEQKRPINVVAVNDITDTKTLAHLFKYDSNYGTYKGTVSYTNDAIIIDGKEIKVFAEKDPSKLPWKALGVRLAVESTGLFTSKDKAMAHIQAGAEKVIISAPADGADSTINPHVNDEALKKEHVVISTGSCTTNSLSPLVKVLEDNFGIVKGFMTTVHGYTNDQRILDLPHKDLRRARAAAMNTIPTSTGAAKAIHLVIPSVKGKLDGMALRVPVSTGSITDLKVIVKRPTTVEEVNAAFKKASEGPMGKALLYCTDEIVSRDIIGETHSCIFDSLLTKVNGELVNVFGWYDNEYGYTNRAVDLIEMVQKLL
ncbi:MAG: type I glyceraldehyde-3-phosphate dehydrogenase [Mesoaciditoga sp.]|uniref:type I glyceraldehyde-3-phosphate dehydrogenase n=1 Tax=Athalassotoga sp. TaxID=2022597 RepID=UPI000CBE44BD|nr:MAG: type I glyceraldehyde-3-phosphate dehydrogenase [Mesoaciditoga sp.]HEU24424.1 type I glyceraldehyde-3-phosphate dehydrogenase [Mesoaciditoga lauensis]